MGLVADGDCRANKCVIKTVIIGFTEWKEHVAHFKVKCINLVHFERKIKRRYHNINDKYEILKMMKCNFDFAACSPYNYTYSFGYTMLTQAYRLESILVHCFQSDMCSELRSGWGCCWKTRLKFHSNTPTHLHLLPRLSFPRCRS